MARFCNQCNKRFGLFEDDFEGICRNCYEEKIKQDNIKKQEIITKLEERIEKLEYERKIEEEKRKKELKILEQEKKLKEKQEIIKGKKNLEEQKYNKIIEEQKVVEKEKQIKLKENKINEKEKKKKEFQEYLERLELERKIKVEEEKKKKHEEKLLKEKVKQEKLKQKKLEQEKIQRNKKKLLIKLEKEQELINENLLNIFKDISLFVEHTRKIINFKKHIDLYMLILKRIMIEIPKDFKATTIQNLKLKTKNNILEEFDEKKDLCLFIYDEIVELLQYNLVQKEIDNFKNETELFEMYVSLVKMIDDKEYIINKIYTMYNNFYSKTFTKKKSKDDLQQLIQIMSKQSEYEKYRDEFFSKNKDIISIIPYIDNKSLTKFISLIEKTNYFSEVSNINIEEFAFMIDSFLYKVSIEEKIFVLENLPKIYEKLKKDLKKQKLVEEKERLLKGNFSKEIEMQKQAVEYSNVHNGYEFEEYVANLYKKLGYTIKEVTKKSGDQRCRCYRI